MAKDTRQTLKDVINRVLRKVGKTPETLDTEVSTGQESEIQAYKKWLAILDKGPITLDKFLDTIRKEIRLAQDQLECVDVKLDERDDLWLKMSLRFNRFYLELFEVPDQARERLIGYLKKKHDLK